MNSVLEALISSEKDNWESALEVFVSEFLDVFTILELNEGTKRKDVWNAIYNIAKHSEDPNVLKNCFIAVRILSREKDHLGKLVNDDWVEILKLHSGLGENFEFNEDKSNICAEVLKCLSNLLFNSQQLASNAINNGILDGLNRRISNVGDKTISDEIRFMDVRLLFLITAKCTKARKEINYMVKPLIEILEETLKKAPENHVEHEDLPPIFLTDAQVDLVSEVLKALFNLTIHVNDSDPEVLASCCALVKILRSYLLISSTNLEKTWALRNNVINLLTNMPNDAYSELMVPIMDGHKMLKSLEYEGQNMTAIYEILMFLKAKFNDEPSVSNQHEILSPVVTVLLKGSTRYRAIRKFLRNQILPPLTDVHSRPEEGKTIRNHLCRMLTTPITQLRDLVADFLFVLCKNSVARMIKYTGYGNAAGLFAQRGLLAGGRDKGQDDYSSDSEDSETEEYADHKHGINPVIGCYEEPHPSAMADMTEEQKEYEAMKLVELMDSLMKCGTIKPCVIGEDGKPKPVDHVLELQEGLKSQQIHINDDESD